ncbi:MAG: hypothetical protein ABI471_02515 [Sphingomonas bacterium]
MKYLITLRADFGPISGSAAAAQDNFLFWQDSSFATSFVSHFK